MQEAFLTAYLRLEASKLVPACVWPACAPFAGWGLAAALTRLAMQGRDTRHVAHGRQRHAVHAVTDPVCASQAATVSSAHAGPTCALVMYTCDPACQHENHHKGCQPVPAGGLAVLAQQVDLPSRRCSLHPCCAEHTERSCLAPVGPRTVPCLRASSAPAYTTLAQWLGQATCATDSCCSERWVPCNWQPPAVCTEPRLSLNAGTCAAR